MNAQVAMARRRHVKVRPWLCTVVTGIALTAGLAGFILLANEVTRMRAEIAQLDTERSALIVRCARSMSEWNAASSRGVVMARATTELGLVSPEVPGRVLMLGQPETADDPDLWRRVIAAVTGGEPIPAAVAAARP